MLSNDLNNTDVIIRHDNNIITFADNKSLCMYCKENNIKVIESMQTNYWGTYVINNNVDVNDIKATD